MSENYQLWFDLSELDQAERDEFEDLRVDLGIQLDRSADPRALGFDPVSAAVVIGGVVVLGRMFASLWERWQGGTVIELTDKGPKIYRDREMVAFGFFLVISKDGKVKVEAKDEPKDALERMGEAILELPVNASIETIKDALKAASSKKKIEAVS